MRTATTTGARQNVTTPNVVPSPSTTVCAPVRSRLGAAPWRIHANSRYDAVTTMLFSSGATTGTEK